MKKRYEAKGGREVWDNLTQNTICICATDVHTNVITEALNIADEYYDKVLDKPIRAISEF